MQQIRSGSRNSDPGQETPITIAGSLSRQHVADIVEEFRLGITVAYAGVSRKTLTRTPCRIWPTIEGTGSTGLRHGVSRRCALRSRSPISRHTEPATRQLSGISCHG